MAEPKKQKPVTIRLTLEEFLALRAEAYRAGSKVGPFAAACIQQILRGLQRRK